MADLRVLDRFFDADTIARGQGYADDERVLRVTRKGGSRVAGDVLLAVVAGSRRQTYTCLVTLDRDTDGSLRSVTGSCTCPMRVNCKHVVATLVVDWVRNEQTRLPAWEQALRALVPTRAERAYSPLGLLVQFEPGPPTRLRVRPLTVGSRGNWVQQGISWRDMGYRRYYDHASYAGHDPALLSMLHELHLLVDDSTSGYYKHAPTWLELSEAGNPRIWDVLSAASETGLVLLRDDKARSRVTIGPEPASLAVEVTRDAGLVLAPVLRVGGTEPTTYRLVGSPPHAVVHWYGDPARWELARLDRVVPAELAGYVERGAAPLRVPAPDEARFVREYLPALRGRIPVRAVDDSVELPDVVEAAAVLTVTYRPGHEALLHWHWTGVDPGVGERVPTPFERSVVLAVQAEAGGMVEVGAYGLQLVPERAVRGMGLVRFLDEDLPAIAKLEGVRVEVDGAAPDYREVVDEPVVQVSSTPTDDRDWYDLAVTVSVGGENVAFYDLFTALARHEESLLLPSGAYFSLTQDALVRLRDLIDEARALQDRPSRAGLRISRYQSSLWEELAALGVVEDQAQRWGQALARIVDPTPVPRALPESVHARLRPYQHEGFEWLSSLRGQGLGGVLADDMGLGKTLQTLAMIAAARDVEPGAAPYLVVAPASVVGNWVAECARFTPGLRVVALQETGRRRGQDVAKVVAGADIVVTTYTLFRLEFGEYEDLPWSGLILDEAQFVKNRTSKTYGCARLLQAPVKFAITGTPLENNLLELWSLLSITAPGLFPSPERFAEWYGRPIEKAHNQDRLVQLRRRIGPFLLRRTKEQVAADLPPKQEQVVELELHPRHRKVYDQHLQRERQKVLGMIDDLEANRFAIFRSLTLLRRLSLSPSLVDPEYAKVPATKLDELVPQLEEIVEAGHKVLVFSQFTTFLGQLRERLDASAIPHAYLDGQTRRRDEVIERFTSGQVPVFLISLKAGGFGLNLTAADYVFILDPWWNPATEAQAVDRAHRIGQDKRVTVYRLVAKGTIEEKVMALKESKAKLFDAVMAEDAAAGRALTADDIRALLA